MTTEVGFRRRPVEINPSNGRMRREEPAAGRALDLREPRERVHHRGGGIARALEDVDTVHHTVVLAELCGALEEA